MKLIFRHSSAQIATNVANFVDCSRKIVNQVIKIRDNILLNSRGRGIVFRLSDASKKHFSWFPDRIQKGKRMPTQKRICKSDRSRQELSMLRYFYHTCT